MPAPTISYMICTGALIVLIFTVQLFYLHVVDNIWADMAKRELKEITDYVSDTIANLYFLANSTNADVSLEKTLNLPKDVSGSGYNMSILRDSGNFAQRVQAAFKGKAWLKATSWLPPGLKVNLQKDQTIEGGGRHAVAGCSRVSSNTYVWIGYKSG